MVRAYTTGNTGQLSLIPACGSDIFSVVPSPFCQATRVLTIMRETCVLQLPCFVSILIYNFTVARSGDNPISLARSRGSFSAEN